MQACTTCVYSLAEIGQFQKIVGGLMELMDELAKEVETEKMKVSSKGSFYFAIVRDGLVVMCLMYDTAASKMHDMRKTMLTV